MINLVDALAEKAVRKRAWFRFSPITSRRAQGNGDSTLFLVNEEDFNQGILKLRGG